MAQNAGLAWRWLGKNPLLDPETLLGAVVVAVLIALACSVASRLLNRVMRRSSGLITRLARGQVDETVLRYALRIKTVLVFAVGGVFYASLIPALRGLLGTLVASAGITALVWASPPSPPWPTSSPACPWPSTAPYASATR